VSPLSAEAVKAPNSVVTARPPNTPSAAAAATRMSPWRWREIRRV
jgi:hypothetical protein